MRILVVNDDGIEADGIHALAKPFLADNEVFMIAPVQERSGFSHSVTIFRDMVYRKTKHLAESYAVDGTPADCVKLGLIHLFKNRLPDLVLSGINSGPNLGSDIMYSGTVAAASEAVFLGIPAIAVSLGTWEADQNYYTAAADFVFRNLCALYHLAKKYAGEILLSINYPCTADFRGGVFTKAGINWYDDYFDEGAQGIVQLKGQPVQHKLDETDCDVAWVKKGFASISPIRIDRNHYEILEHYKDKVALE
ncbi:MAG: 5'/3'-nucleotidase SurE [Firmicutes bacterium]|nr:5'/3'-nucleotidase SurE [Bacillota bacterium]